MHVLFVGVLAGSYLFEVVPTERAAWWIGAMLSGLMMLALDLHESGAFLLQVRGLVLLLKLGVLLVLPWLGAAAGWALAALVLISVVSSHAPGKVRYKVVFGGGRIVGGESHG